MTAKLIKREDGLYFLNDNLGNLVYGKLSKKNCQEIEQKLPKIGIKCKEKLKGIWGNFYHI